MKEYYFKGYAVVVFKSIGKWCFVATPKKGDVIKGHGYPDINAAEQAADSRITPPL